MIEGKQQLMDLISVFDWILFLLVVFYFVNNFFKKNKSVPRKPEPVSMKFNSVSKKCWYGSLCLKNNCSFSHPSNRRRTFPIGCQVATKCKYGYNCYKRDCRYNHPSDKCWYGNDCGFNNCRFIHPKVKKRTGHKASKAICGCSFEDVTGPVSWRIDPYYEDIHNDIVWDWFCEHCYHETCMDI